MSDSNALDFKTTCPVCKESNGVGSCGHNRFFCNECCIEIKIKKDRAEVYEVTEDGRAVLIEVIKIKRP